MMKLSRILPLVVSGASPALALSYTFSFTNVDGSVPGTVGGTIELPSGDGTFAATSVIVNSAPAALGYTLPFDVLSNFTDVFANTFTMVGGTIDPIASQFLAQNASEAFTLNFSLISRSPTSHS